MAAVSGFVSPRLNARAERRFVFFSGGTGGHLAPALAVARALEDLAGDSVRLVFFTASRQGERAFERRAGYTFHELPLAQPRRVVPLLRFTAQAGSRFGSLRRYLDRCRPYACFGLGGYLSLPGVAAARALGIPVYLLEQNMVPGRVNRLLAPLATGICTSFPTAGPFRLARRVVYTGNPVRTSFLELRREPQPQGDDAPVRIAVLGGSQGARALNEAVLAALPHLTELRHRVSFVHAAGPQAVSVAEAYRGHGITADVAPFFPDIAERIAGADMALTRAGGSSIAELLVLGVPLVLVPFPHSRDGHQQANAAFVAEHGAGVTYLQHVFDGDVVAGLVREVVFQRKTWETRARNAYRLGRPDAARAVATFALRRARDQVRGGIR